MNKIKILVPDLPESVSDAVVVKWYKKQGEKVFSNENIVDLETDKVMLEVTSPCDGILDIILEKEGATVKSNQILGNVIKSEDNEKKNKKEIKIELATSLKKSIKDKNFKIFYEEKKYNFTPSKRRSIRINKNIEEFCKSNFLQKKENFKDREEKKFQKNEVFNEKENKVFENRIQMTRLRQKIAERLLETKNNTAMLTTFNEVNMQPIILLRKKYGESFEKKHGIRMGFMSFFVKAVTASLKYFPEINASIDNTDIVYYKNFNISIAVSTPRGLITPVLRNTDNMSIADIEKKIKEFSIKSIENKIKLEELIGGNFTITNGGIFGSLMSTPIINPPQTAILGMHAIKERPMAINGKVKILPMMYLALSYDHRLIDGKESVGFLKNVKDILEDFNRFLINV